MGYTIEISVDVRKPNMLLKSVRQRRELAEAHLCEMQYFMNEIEGNKRQIIKNDSIHVVYFAELQFQNLLDFIKNLRKDKSFYIECIYRDDNSTNLLFVSPKYLKKMDKNVAKNFQKEMKKKIIDEEKMAILAAFKER
jgi:hypothetical protein|tara:strand:+ start:50 stop:463 length:414 start_codon:yes stop_codon:yes gene_type:complete